MKQLPIILMMLLTICSAQAAQKAQRQKLPVTRAALTPTVAVLGAVAIGVSGYLAYRVKQRWQLNKVLLYQELLWDGAYEGDAKSVEAAIRHGADVNMSDKHGDTPLWNALLGERYNGRADYTEVVRLLLQAGAKSSKEGHTTAREYASSYRCHKALKAIEEFEKMREKCAEQENDTKQAEVPIETQKDGKKAKHVHFQDQHEEITDVPEYQEMLEWGALGGNVEQVSEAIRNGAHVNVPDEDGDTPLYLVALGAYKNGNYTQVAHLLLEAGALIEGRAEMTARDNNKEIAKIFEQHREKLLAKQQAEKEAENKPKRN